MNNTLLGKIGNGLKNIISPEKEAVSEGNHKSKLILFDPDKCIICGLCSIHCPEKAIELKDASGIRTIIRDQTKCTTCGKCLEICQINSGSKIADVVSNTYDESQSIDNVSGQLVICDNCNRPIGSRIYLEFLSDRIGAQTYSHSTLLSLRYRRLGLISNQNTNCGNSYMPVLCPQCISKDF